MRKIRKLKVNEIKQSLKIAAKSYPMIGLTTDAKIEEFEKEILKDYPKPEREWYGLFEEDQLLGNMVLYDFDLNYYGKIIKTKGIGFVATDFLHKKQKIARDLLNYYLKICNKEDKKLAMLYAFRPDFYKKMGFGYGTKGYNYQTKADRFPILETNTSCNYLDQSNKNEVSEFFNELYLSNHGMIAKREKDIEAFLKPENQTVIGFRDNDNLVSILTFNFKVDKEHNDETDMHCRLYYKNHTGLKAISSFINSQSDQIRDIFIYSQDDSLFYLLKDIRHVDRDILQPPAYHHLYNAGMGIMFRAMDNQYLVLNKPSTLNDFCIKFIIEDDFVENTKDALIIEYKNGIPKICRSRKCDLEIEFKQAEFSSWVMNCISLEKLHQLGLINVNNENLLKVADQGFYYSQHPICYARF